MKSRIVLLIAIFVSLGIIYAIFNAEKKQINANEQPTKQNQVCVKLVYDKPIEGYEVTADWQPFEAKGCETGYITINFRDISTGKEFQYINREKFSSYHTDLITSAEGFDGYKDGDVYHIEYVTKPSPFEESPIDYYLPFQFYDIDFDGEKELLINIYDKGQPGNGYDVFEITDAGLIEKSYPPFNLVDNMMKFDNQNKIITYYQKDGVYYSSFVHCKKVATSTLQKIAIPDELEKSIKSKLADFTPNEPSDFHIIAAKVLLGDDEYKLEVKNGKWEIVKHTKSSI